MAPSQQETDRWAVSPYNFDEEVRADMNLPSEVTVMDLTLRESRQIDGASLTVKQIREVARRLDAAGIPAIEMHHDDPEEIRTVADLGLSTDIMALIHPTAALDPETAVEEVEECVEAGADIVCFAYPISRYNFPLFESMAGSSPTREEALELACDVIGQAAGTDATVCCLLMDFTRADLDWLTTSVEQLATAGADIIRTDDICAPCSPAVVRHHIEHLKEAIPETPIAIHTHDDFGLATALQLAALEGGAEILEGTVNGYGERAGVSHLAELVACLELFYGYDTGIELERLTPLSEFVADVYNQPMSPFLPAVGERAFSHTAEVHYVLPKDDRWSFDAWTPDVTGNSSYVPLCHHSGPESIKRRADDQGLGELTDEVATTVLASIREELRLRQAPLSDATFSRLVEQARE